MALYTFGGGISGEAGKIAFRESNKFEHRKMFKFTELNKNYVNFLSCLKTLKTSTVTSKSQGCYTLQPKIYVLQDSKTKFWHGVETLPKTKK